MYRISSCKYSLNSQVKCLFFLDIFHVVMTVSLLCWWIPNFFILSLNVWSFAIKHKKSLISIFAIFAEKKTRFTTWNWVFFFFFDRFRLIVKLLCTIIKKINVKKKSCQAENSKVVKYAYNKSTQYWGLE